MTQGPFTLHRGPKILALKLGAKLPHRNRTSSFRLGIESAPMCDYSLHHVKTRPANSGDKLVTHQFVGSFTRGFASPDDLNVAVCLLPGTELSFSGNVRRLRPWPWSKTVISHKTAIFRQVNLANPNAHHDALEFPDGQVVLLNALKAGQQARILQLPATAAGLKLPLTLTYIVHPNSQ
jgi:hypothetical protein